MLFMVEMSVNLAPDMPADARDGLLAREKAYSKRSSATGRWVHLWRVAGRYANVNIFDVGSPDELHELVSGLPLYRLHGHPRHRVGAAPVGHRNSRREMNRSETLVSALLDAIRGVIVEHDVSYKEYGIAKQWLIDVGEAGEWPLFLDVFVETAVERNAFRGRAGSAGTILGPYHLRRPAARPPYELPRRADEAGEPLTLTGRVLDAGGAPLAGAVLDVWHADADGLYSGFRPTFPRESCAARSPPMKTAATRCARSCPRRTRSRTTARPARWSRPATGIRGGRRTCT